MIPCQCYLTTLAATISMEQSKEALWRPPRSCDEYWSEFKHCKSLPSAFHHYYTFGSFPLCQQWKIDYYSCRDWEKHRSKETKEALRSSERNRLAKQKNVIPVWEMRKEPPIDWHMPLNHDQSEDS